MIMQTFVLTAAGILTISTLFAGFLFYTYREPLLKYFLWLWIGAIVGFAAQGIFNNLGLTGFLAFATNAFGVCCLLMIHEKAASVKLPWKIYLPLMTLGGVSSTALFIAGVDFTLSATPFSIATALVLFHAAMTGSSPLRSLQTGYRVMLFLNALHFVDYPIFRSDETLGVIGFAITLAFFFLYAVFIPLFIMKQLSDRYTVELENKVDSRTKDLKEANDSLTLANSELNSLSAENRSLLSVLVHDLGNPLNVLHGTADIFDRSQLSKEGIEDMQRMDRAIRQIKETIDHASTFQLARVGKLSKQEKQVDLVSVINRVVQDFETKIKAKNLTVQIQTDNTLPTYLAQAEEERLKNQILANLVSNAIKFSYTGGIIQIAIAASDAGLSVKVRDYGVGISEEKAKTIFDFNQPTTSGTGGEKGMGLGLPIVKYYAKSMGGDVIVEKPEEQTGACFEVQLKAAA